MSDKRCFSVVQYASRLIGSSAISERKRVYKAQAISNFSGAAVTRMITIPLYVNDHRKSYRTDRV